MRKVNAMNEEEAVRNYATYRKRLPKDFRTESKTRIAMFKESLRISCQVGCLMKLLSAIFFSALLLLDFFLFFDILVLGNQKWFITDEF